MSSMLKGHIKQYGDILGKEPPRTLPCQQPNKIGELLLWHMDQTRFVKGGPSRKWL